VNKGDEVKTGQSLQGRRFSLGNIHASVSGKVSKIEEVQDVSGYDARQYSLRLQVMNGNQELIGYLSRERLAYDSAEILNGLQMPALSVWESTFPTHVKLTVQGEKSGMHCYQWCGM